MLYQHASLLKYERKYESIIFYGTGPQIHQAIMDLTVLIFGIFGSFLRKLIHVSNNAYHYLTLLTSPRS